MFPRKSDNLASRATTQFIRVGSDVPGLTERDFATASMHSEVRRAEQDELDASIGLDRYEMSVAGWLSEINSAEQSTKEVNTTDEVLGAELTPERRDSEAMIADIAQITKLLTEVRNSPYVKQHLANKTRDDFDLAA